MQTKAIIQSHWFSFLFLVPFVVMLWVHRLLRLSDALMIQTPPGERDAHTYNLVMAAVFFCGVTGFLSHAFSFARRDRVWLTAKLVFLVVYCTIVMFVR
jgi:uncharacterized membrane protein SirB2